MPGALVGLPFAEIRLDRMEVFPLEDVGTLFSSHERLIATAARARLRIMSEGAPS